MAYKITDNYLKQEHYQNLKTLITDNDFPWRRRWNMYKDGHPSNKGFFTFCFYNLHTPQSKYFEPYILPILNSLGATTAIQVRANMVLKEFFGKPSIPFHVDYKNLGNKYKTAILNFTNDGGTIIKVNKKIITVESKENRLLLMDGNINHTTKKNNKLDLRYLLNINFI